ncbi:MAG TPA: CAP domain-containing protein [Candidatus Dormibacteraeota bacterium]
MWAAALVLFVAVAFGTQSVLRGDMKPSAPDAASPSSVSTGPAPAGLTPPIWVATPAFATKIAIVTTQQLLINRDRARYARRQLSWSSCLATIAHSNAVRMAKQGYISHTNGATRDLGCHLGYHTGENVGWYSPVPSDSATNAAFMASAVHRANILGLNYRYVGTSWVKGANGHWYIAVEFG